MPDAGYYQELLNSDAWYYGGSNVGNQGGLATEEIAAHGRPCSLNLTLPLDAASSPAGASDSPIDAASS